MNTLAPLMRDVLSVSTPPPARALHVNYRYMLAWARAVAARRPEARILDFGCGDGLVVEAARTLGLDVHGADVFYGGEDDRRKVARRGLLGSFIHEIRGGRLPFEDRSVDLVLSNQVFEHVEKLDGTLAELARVLRRDGILVCLFPTREVVREAHCGVPFLHWLPRGWPARRRYAACWHGIGFSFDKENKTRDQWAGEAVEWMDRYVFYRRRAEVLREFARHFEFDSSEEHYLAYRFSRRRIAPLLRVPWVREASRVVCRRFNGVVLVGRIRPA